MVRAKVYFSGTLITSIFNFLLIICLGTHDEGADADEFAYGKHHTTGRHATAEPELPGAGMDPEAARAV